MAPRMFLLSAVTFILAVQGAFGEGVFTASCDTGQQSMTFTYVNDPTRSAVFIFAEGKDSTCSATSSDPQVSGDGSSGTPYTLTISPIANVAHATACGVESSGNTYWFTVNVKFGIALAVTTNDDRQYNLTCDFPPPRSPVLAQYACDGTKKIHFNYLNAATTPFDIYAFEKRSTCGMKAGFGRGAATAADRFELAIDLAGNQTPDCGAQETSNNTYEVSVIVQTTQDILRAEDMIYRLVCNFSDPFTELSSADGVTVDNQLTNGTATNLEGQARIIVTDDTGNPVTRIRIGQLIKLQVDLVGSEAEGLRVRECKAKPSRTSSKEVQLLGTNGCQAGSLGLMDSFSSPAGDQATTDPFKAFRFDAANSLVFICLVDFCYDLTKQGCVGTHCTTNRKRRNLDTNKQEEVSAVVVILDASEFDSQSGSNKNTTTGPPEVQGDCDGSHYWAILGFTLVAIALLLIVTFFLIFFCLKVRRRSRQEKSGK